MALENVAKATLNYKLRILTWIGIGSDEHFWQYKSLRIWSYLCNPGSQSSMSENSHQVAVLIEVKQDEGLISNNNSSTTLGGLFCPTWLLQSPANEEGTSHDTFTRTTLRTEVTQVMVLIWTSNICNKNNHKIIFCQYSLPQYYSEQKPKIHSQDLGEKGVELQHV